jgi:hypothetical protein
MNIINSVINRLKPRLNVIKYEILALRQNNYSVRHKNKPIITIFGCCRQDSIYKHFKVTDVRNGLTYPHFSKEVIQAIEYCKYLNTDIPEWAFRNPQINLKLRRKKSLMRDFNRTDIFIVEIASLLEYKHNGFYLHHEIYDNPSQLRKNGWPTKDQIETREQSLEELRKDLQKIVDLLGERRIIFACHISTRESGKRATLISEISKFCRDRNIECFVPSDILNFYNASDIFVEEPVLSHFTDFGHQIAGFRYRELVERKYCDAKSNSKPLVQTLEKPLQNRNEFSSGLGDFLNGSLKVYQVARKLNRIPRIDISNSNFSNHLEGDYADENLFPIKKIYHEDSDTNFIKARKVFTNKVSISPLTIDQKDFVYRNCLTPKAALKSKIEEVKTDYDLHTKSYEVLHIRVSDDFDKNPDTKLLAEILDLLDAKRIKKSKSLMLLSNSNVVRNYFLAEGFLIPKGEILHSSDPNASTNSIENTLVEFFLISGASKIYQFSTYEWGSGFSALAAKLFDIPLESIERVAK